MLAGLSAAPFRRSGCQCSRLRACTPLLVPRMARPTSHTIAAHAAAAYAAAAHAAATTTQQPSATCTATANTAAEPLVAAAEPLAAAALSPTVHVHE